MSAADRSRWDGVYGRRSVVGAPSPFLTSVADLLPASGRALDLAGGDGRNALLLAEHGLDVTVADASPVALALARAQAEARGLALRTLLHDLDDGLPAGPWDVVLNFNFLDRRLFASLAAELAPGGWFVFLQPTTTNLERNPRPSARFLLAPGELANLLSSLHVVRLEEDWSDGRHEARALARRA